MRTTRRLRPRLEPLESLALLSGIAPAHHISTPALVTEARPGASQLAILSGTLHGTFFAHTGSPASGTVYSLFASGKIGPTGPTLLNGGFQQSGFTARGVGGGNLVLNSEANRGTLALRLSELSGPSAGSPGSYLFEYQVARGVGAATAGRSGTVEITLRPIKKNLQGQPFSNPGFFGNSTFTFQPAITPAAAASATPNPATGET
jgi:hypothetical protein